MVRPRIFVSHSSRCTAATGCRCREYLLSLERHLTDLGCDPVVDKNILTGGDTWNSKLLHRIRHCHGMIVLLSPHALTSYHVMEEVIAATAQQAGDEKNFLILPLTLPGVRRAQLPDSRLGRANLGRYDMVDWTADAGPDRPPAKIGASLRPLLVRLGCLPHPELTEFVAELIAELSDAVLENSAKILGVATLAYADDTSRYFVAQGLLRERPVRDLGDPCDLRKALTLILPRIRRAEDRQTVVDVAVPFARVPRQAAEQLRRIGRAPSGRVALLRSTMNETPGMYVRRASEAPETWLLRKPVPRHHGAGFVEGVVAEIRGLLQKEFTYDDPCSDEVLDRLLARHEEESGPVTIVFHQPPDAELVSRLLDEYRRLLFLFAHPQIGTDGALAGTTALQALTPGQEQDMVYTHRDFSPSEGAARPTAAAGDVP
ncbi:toll/interleukin-1 receptor domain-containing protein [Streptomyces sp. A012304]|uniref:toll/interleukin-1 receptor domain-containing protein n=1 Tax=Streptomyces sp. A012304 TaxID=375446 RepID=UPI002230FAF3|nr:toll/interleukin-1 receptor domain-containing protein [Streptomyces sp. A012304]GKQ38816.1 hypothetical protein ALMP_53450 [Streptomyces sp. A012304]